MMEAKAGDDMHLAIVCERDALILLAVYLTLAARADSHASCYDRRQTRGIKY
jgi:hypothetical protein